MTALSADKARYVEKMSRLVMTLATGQSVYKGAAVAVTTGVGTVVEVTSTTGIIPIGCAAEAVDATSVAKNLTVDFDKELTLTYFVNDTGTALTSADIGALCYFVDDQTVSGDSTGRVAAGRVWVVSSTRGVGVEVLSIGAEYGTAAATLAAPRTGSLSTPGGTTDIAVTSGQIVNGKVYLLPSLATNTTVTLATAGVTDGTQITIVADGTQGAFTTTYRYGTTAITSAMTASKAHSAVLTKYGTLWMGSFTVSA